MNILIVDTSTEKSIIALIENSNLTQFEELPIGLHSAQYLVNYLKKILDKSHFHIEKLNAIAVGIGPGSFTGIRVGVAFSKGLSFRHKLPLIPFSSLEGYVSSYSEKFVSVIDARSGIYYVLRERLRNGTVTSQVPSFFSFEEATEALKNFREIICPKGGLLKDKLPYLSLVEKDVDINYLSQKIISDFLNFSFVIDGNIPLTYIRQGSYIQR